MARASAAVLLALAPLSAQDRTVPFDRFAKAFRASHGLPAEGPADLAALLQSRYLRVRIGQLDVFYPAHDLRPERVEDLAQVLAGLADLHVAWIHAFAAGGDAPAQAVENARALRQWLATRPPAKWRAASEARGGDLLPLLGADEGAERAFAALASAMETGAALGTKDAASRAPARVVLSPTRAHFVETCAFLGTVDEQNRAIFWQENVPERTQVDVVFPLPFRLVAMEYAAPKRAAGDFISALRMDAREDTGLVEHVVQCAALSLVQCYLGSEADGDLAAGLAQNLVIEVCGANNTRLGGDERGRTTGGSGGFVAGGRSQGCGIAPANLDSRWRARKGGGYFVDVLRRGQREGGRKSHDARAPEGHFALRSDDESESFVVDAPFLGREAPAPVPAAFVPDQRELLRAYRSGFVHWLRELGDKDVEASHAKFGTLLRALMDAQGKTPLTALCAQVYGMPLTGPTREPPSLEWRFLGWLAHGHG